MIYFCLIGRGKLHTFVNFPIECFNVDVFSEVQRTTVGAESLHGHLHPAVVTSTTSSVAYKTITNTDTNSSDLSIPAAAVTTHDCSSSNSSSSSSIESITGTTNENDNGSAASLRSPIYDLCAVTSHWGELGGGHYIAHAKHCKTGQW